MTRLLAPAAAAILLSLAVGACASNQAAETASDDVAPSVSASAAPETTNPPSASAPMAGPSAVSPTSPMPQTSAFSEAQIQSFARASVQVDQIQARHQAGLASGTPEQQAAARQAMGAELAAVLQQNGIDPATYNNIARTARTDPALAQRITTLRAQAGAPG